MRALKKTLQAIIPPSVFRALLSAYHFCIGFLASVVYGFPSKSITVVAVTGTKGKSSTIEFLNAICEAAGYTTALTSTIRFKVGEESTVNTRKMSMPGRFFIQKFLRSAVEAQCDIAILETTSEGTLQHRHRFIAFNALVFTNLSPEHIEAHGSFEAYAQAKLNIARALVRSSKRPRIIVANADDARGADFLSTPVEMQIPFSLVRAQPVHTNESGSTFMFEGIEMKINLPGEHNVRNALAAASVAYVLGIKTHSIEEGLAKVTLIPGRTQEISVGPAQPFPVVVDYAHTPDSLEALYKAYGSRRKICVLGAAGGGRDRWKRPEMGKIASTYCDAVILTNEDPYDEDPQAIIADIFRGMGKKPEVIIDRRSAIQRAIKLARADSAVLISGKGSETVIMGANGKRVPWNDAEVAREELARIFGAAKTV